MGTNHFISLYLGALSQQVVVEPGEDKSPKSSTKWQISILISMATSEEHQNICK